MGIAPIRNNHYAQSSDGTPKEDSTPRTWSWPWLTDRQNSLEPTLQVWGKQFKGWCLTEGMLLPKHIREVLEDELQKWGTGELPCAAGGGREAAGIIGAPCITGAA